jgi:hypothetical protein
MKGINFIEPLFRKVVSGGKTQTRRIIVSRTGFFNVIGKNGFVKEVWQCDADGWNGEDLIPVRPRYKPGETLYLKEPYAVLDDMILYRYGSNGESTVDTWQNKLFMPGKYARYFIEITGVRAERLQEISDEDCMKEGIREERFVNFPYETFYVIPDMSCPLSNTPREAYAVLINEINGCGTWESNPFVWVYDFKLKAK